MLVHFISYLIIAKIAGTMADEYLLWIIGSLGRKCLKTCKTLLFGNLTVNRWLYNGILKTTAYEAYGYVFLI